MKSLQKKISHLKASPAATELYADNRVNHLQQRLEELRRLQSGRLSSLAQHETSHEEEEEEGSQSDGPGTQETAGDHDAEEERMGQLELEEERACLVLAELRRTALQCMGGGWMPKKPTTLAPSSKAGLKRKRAEVEESSSRGGSYSSGATVPLGASPIMHPLTSTRDRSVAGFPGFVQVQ